MFDNLSVDIIAFLRTAMVLIFLGALFSIVAGIRAIRGSRKLPYFRQRRIRLMRGWRMLFWAFLLAILGAALALYGDPIAYRLVDITPTPIPTATTTLTPTLTISPTTTLSPTVTLTPRFTYTPTATPTAHMPFAVEAQFTSQVTPNPEAVFSPLTFSRGLTPGYEPIGPGEVFDNPIEGLYASFSYDFMQDGVQWTALWYRDGELVHFETLPWDGGTGGLGYTDWSPEPDQWLPGNYQVQIFVGVEWKVVGDFVVEGLPPTLTPTVSATPTVSSTPTATATATPSPSATAFPSATASPNSP